MRSKPKSIKDDVRPGTNDSRSSVETAKRIRPDRTNKYENDPFPSQLRVFSQSKASNANAGMWARLDNVCSVADPTPKYDRSGKDDM